MTERKVFFLSPLPMGEGAQRACEGLKLKSAFTFANFFSPSPACQCKTAFTLAEVLITLGIIGVVAALTIPALIVNHKKQVVVSRMEKFYSSFNQAITRGVVDNGDVKLWNNVEVASNGVYMEKWWKQYMAPYMQITSTKVYNNGILNSLSDGSGFGIVATCSQEAVGDKGATVCIHVYFCTEFNKCEKNLDSKSVITSSMLDGKNTFLFHINSYNGLSAYAVNWDGTREMLLEKCSTANRDFCARLIQSDGWRIEKDYPIGF